MVKLFVGGLSQALHKEPKFLHDYFSQFGTILTIRNLKKLNQKQNNKEGYYAFIRFREEDEPINLILDWVNKKGPIMIMGKRVDVGRSEDLK